MYSFHIPSLDRPPFQLLQMHCHLNVNQSQNQKVFPVPCHTLQLDSTSEIPTH